LGKLRWKIGGLRYVAELLNNATFLSLFPIFLYKPCMATISFAISVSLIKTMGDYCVGRRIGASDRVIHYLFVPLKDLIIGLIWFVPLFSSTVTWRGNKYKIGKGSALLPNPPPLNAHSQILLRKRGYFPWLWKKASIP
jgi:ceramide glucosyltransferase